MKTPNIINESWEAERIYALLRKKGHHMATGEIAERTKLAPSVVAAACRDLRNADVIVGSNPWKITKLGASLNVDPDILEDPDEEDDETV